MSQPKRKGDLHIITGPMWSGKTSALRQALMRYKFANKNTLAFAYNGDVRYSVDNEIVTHEKLCLPAVRVSHLADVPDSLILEGNYTAVGIDEAQFFPDLAATVAHWINLGLHVYVAGLDSTYRMQPFGQIHLTMCMATSIRKLTAVCMRCGAEAPFTGKIAGGSIIEEVGGDDKYISVCHDCHEVVLREFDNKQPKHD